MIYTIPFLYLIAGRLHGWGGFTGCKLIAKLIIGLGFGYAVYLTDNSLEHAGVAAIASIVGFSLPHGKFFTKPYLFTLKGAAIAAIPAVYMMSIPLIVGSSLAWGLAYYVSRKTVGYDASQEGKLFAPKIWTFWGEIMSCFLMGIVLVLVVSYDK